LRLRQGLGTSGAEKASPGPFYRAGRGGSAWRGGRMVELGLAGAAGQRGDLGQRYEFRGQMPRLDSNLEIYIAIKRLVLALAES